MVSPVTGFTLYNFLSLVVRYRDPSVSKTIAVKTRSDSNSDIPKPSEALILINVEVIVAIDFSKANTSLLTGFNVILFNGSNPEDPISLPAPVLNQ